MTLQLELSEQVERDLNRIAERNHISEEDLALQALNEFLQRASNNETAGVIADDDWGGISQSVIEDNRELLSRLAK